MKELLETVKRRALVVTLPVKMGGRRRLAVHFFRFRDGAVFFDVGWDQSDGHPTHYLPGPVKKVDDRKWAFTDNNQDPDYWFYVEPWKACHFFELTQNYLMWMTYLEDPENKKSGGFDAAQERFKSEYTKNWRP